MDPLVPSYDPKEEICFSGSPQQNELTLNDYEITVDLESEILLASLPFENSNQIE